MILGFFWHDTESDSLIQVKRARKYPFLLGEFPDIDPYKELYALADSDESEFWKKLELCVRNRTKASQIYKVNNTIITQNAIFQIYEYPVFTQKSPGYNMSCLEEAEAPNSTKSCITSSKLI